MPTSLAQTLKAYFDTMVDLPLQVWKNFGTLGSTTEYPAEHVLKEANTTEKHFRFLLQGSGGLLLWHQNNFVCTDLSFTHTPISDFVSFMLQKSSPLQVRLFEDSQVFAISHTNFLRTFQTGGFGEQVTRLALEAAYAEKEQIQLSLLTKTAKERYLDLLETYPQVSTIPLKYLASYLGITPQSLSRIRSQKLM